MHNIEASKVIARDPRSTPNHPNYAKQPVLHLGLRGLPSCRIEQSTPGHNVYSDEGASVFNPV